MRLPKPRYSSDIAVERALRKRRSVREFRNRALTLGEVSQLLWSAQGVTGPGGLRTAPSAGGLGPLEIDLVAGNVKHLAAGVYRYRPDDHAVDLMVEGDVRREIAEDAADQEWMADAPAILSVSAVIDRTRREYGRDARTYVLIEVGHALENACLQAVALGLGSCVIGAFAAGEVRRLLGIDREETPLALLTVGKPG